MPIKLIGKSVLGDKGLSQNVNVMGDDFDKQLSKVISSLSIYEQINSIAITAMTGSAEIEATKGAYFPKIRQLTDQYDSFYPFLMPKAIYNGCKKGIDKFRPGCDFIVWDSNKLPRFAALTFSREAPILTFESSTGKKALGVILRPSLMKYGDYLFSTIKEALDGNITVTLVTCNHFEYPEGSIPSIVQNLSLKHNINCVIGYDSEKEPECYHRGEKGNHVVALW